jgi:hypothetical protein
MSDLSDIDQLVALLRAYEEDTATNIDDIITLAEQVLITDSGSVNRPMVQKLSSRGFPVYPVEIDRFGWILGGIVTSKGEIIFG